MIAVVPTVLEQRDIEPALHFLAAQPIEHAALLALVRRAQSTLSIRRQFVLARDANGEVCGVMFAGAQTMLSNGAPESLQLLAQSPYCHRAIRAVMGPAAAVEIFLRERERIATPRIDTLQHLYVLRKLDIAPAFLAQHVAEAKAQHIETIVAGAAAMIEDELGYDPRKRTTFRREISNQIQARRWWIADDGEVRLLCRIGATTVETMQLECVWTPPASRGFGYATRALATICAHLLQRRASISLAVNADNDRAIRLYQRLGFVAHGEQRAVLW